MQGNYSLCFTSSDEAYSQPLRLGMTLWAVYCSSYDRISGNGHRIHAISSGVIKSVSRYGKTWLYVTYYCRTIVSIYIRL